MNKIKQSEEYVISGMRMEGIVPAIEGTKKELIQ